MTISEDLVFKIGGIGLGVSNKTGKEFLPLGHFEDFLCSCKPQANYETGLEPPSGKPAADLIFDSGQAWRLFGNQDQRILWVGSRDFIPRMVGDFSPDYHRGNIYVTKSIDGTPQYYFPLSYPVGSLLMTSLLGTGYGLMLHACAVIDAGSGIVFAGIGSAGKTTTGRLWNANTSARILNDDHVILRKFDGRFRVYGTPWHGQGGFSSPEDAPLKKIFIIKHGNTNQAVPLSPPQAAASLLVRTFAALWDASAMAYSLQFLDELCQAIPCYEFGFVPDKTAVEYIRCLP